MLGHIQNIEGGGQFPPRLEVIEITHFTKFSPPLPLYPSFYLSSHFLNKILILGLGQKFIWGGATLTPPLFTTLPEYASGTFYNACVQFQYIINILLIVVIICIDATLVDCCTGLQLPRLLYKIVSH